MICIISHLSKLNDATDYVPIVKEQKASTTTLPTISPCRKRYYPLGMVHIFQPHTKSMLGGGHCITCTLKKTDLQIVMLK